MSMFRKPTEREVGLKVLAQGRSGVGKSRFGLSFPKVMAMDSEAGLARYEGREAGKNLVLVANTQDFNQVQAGISEAEKMVKKEKGAIETFLLDSETKFYQNLTDTALAVEEKKARKKGADINDSNISVRGWGRVKNVATRLQNLKIDLSAKGVNVISISQVDDVKKKIGETFEVIGEKAVMAKGAEYDYDIVISLFTEEQADGTVNYKGKILKDRTDVCFKGQIVDNPSYEIWREHLESGKGEIIESNFTEDNEKARESLTKEDEENDKTTIDKFKELMVNDTCKEIALEAIKKHKIKNPLQPANKQEMALIEGVVGAMEKALEVSK